MPSDPISPATPATSPATSAEMQRPASTQEQMSFVGWYNSYMGSSVPTIQGAIASGELLALVQQWANRTGTPIAVWTPTDQQIVDRLIDYGNRLNRVSAGILSGKYGLQFAAGDMAAVAPSKMPREQYDPDLFPSESFGIVIPVIVWVIVGGVILVGSLFSASEILKHEANRQISKNQATIIQADKEIAKSDPATRRAWQQFKNQNQQHLMEKAKQADGEQDGGIFGAIFGKTASKGIGVAIGIAAAVILVGLAGSVTPEKKKMIYSNPCSRGGRKIARMGPPVKWSKDPAKRKRQVAHIAAYYEGAAMAGQLEHYRKQQEGRGWELGAVYSGPVDYNKVATKIAKQTGAKEIHFDQVPF